jgi:hypothetical protein
LALLFSVAACGDETAAVPPACTELDGVCVGVPAGDICGSAFCVADVSCSGVVEVSDSGALAAALASAAPGSCIAVGPGSYAATTVPAGVSLLGGGAGRVTIAGIAVAGADASEATLRGVRVEGMLQLGGGVHLTVVSAVVSGGVEALAGATLTLSTSQVSDGSGYAVFAQDAALTVERSLIQDNEGPGIWAVCSDGCACAAPPDVALDHVLVQRNGLVGVALAGVNASLHTVDVRETSTGPGLDQGGGLSVSACAEVTLDGVTVSGAQSFGVLIDGASVTQAAGAGALAVSSAAFGGMWIQNIAAGQQVELYAIDLQDNAAVGIGIANDLQEKGIIVIGGGKVARTIGTAVPVVEAGMPAAPQIVGDGILWSGGALAEIRDLSIAASDRNAFLIDGAVASGSVLANVSLQSGDEAKGIVQQGSDASGAPATSGSVPTVEVTAATLFGIPTGPQPPQTVAP